MEFQNGIHRRTSCNPHLKSEMWGTRPDAVPDWLEEYGGAIDFAETLIPGIFVPEERL